MLFPRRHPCSEVKLVEEEEIFRVIVTNVVNGLTSYNTKGVASRVRSAEPSAEVRAYSPSFFG